MFYRLSFIVLFILLPSHLVTGCYDNLRKLIDDVDSIGGDATFVVCPNTNLIGFQYGDFITLKYENTTLQCGSDGSFANNCSFTGGYGSVGPDQVRIRPRSFQTPEGIRVRGFTFHNAKHEAVAAYGSATIEDCTFLNNAGTSQSSQTQQAYAEPGNNHAVVFRRCTFINTNKFGHGGIQSVGAAVVIDQCVFKGVDDDTWGARIGSARSTSGIGSLTIRNSCFEDNLPGALVLESSVPLLENFNNYGMDNGPCEGIVSKSGGQDTCTPFTANRCHATDAKGDDDNDDDDDDDDDVPQEESCARGRTGFLCGLFGGKA